MGETKCGGSRHGENAVAFLEQNEIDALDRQQILQIIEERRLFFVRTEEGRIILIDGATLEEFRELLGLPQPMESTEPLP
jgi:hypothetical protein